MLIFPLVLYYILIIGSIDIDVGIISDHVPGVIQEPAFILTLYLLMIYWEDLMILVSIVPILALMLALMLILV